MGDPRLEGNTPAGWAKEERDRWQAKVQQLESEVKQLRTALRKVVKAISAEHDGYPYMLDCVTVADALRLNLDHLRELAERGTDSAIPKDGGR